RFAVAVDVLVGVDANHLEGADAVDGDGAAGAELLLDGRRHRLEHLLDGGFLELGFADEAGLEVRGRLLLIEYLRVGGQPQNANHRGSAKERLAQDPTLWCRECSAPVIGTGPPWA